MKARIVCYSMYGHIHQMAEAVAAYNALKESASWGQIRAPGNRPIRSA